MVVAAALFFCFSLASLFLAVSAHDHASTSHRGDRHRGEERVQRSIGSGVRREVAPHLAAPLIQSIDRKQKNSVLDSFSHPLFAPHCCPIFRSLRPPKNLRVQVHVVRRRELRLVLVLQDALELVDAPFHEAPPCVEVYRPSFRHRALRFRLGLFGPGRHCGSRGSAGEKVRSEQQKSCSKRARERVPRKGDREFLMLHTLSRGRRRKSEGELGVCFFFFFSRPLF